MAHFTRHILHSSSTVKDALVRLNELASDAIVFVVKEDNELIGSLTDGDLRRGFIKGLDFETPLTDFIQSNPKFIQQGKYDLQQIVQLREKQFTIFPVVDGENRIVNVVNFKKLKSYLPVEALIMAGGRGERLRPLTDDTPKPMLKVGDKPIIEHNIDRLKEFGIDDIWISLKYLGEQVESYFKDGSDKSIRINYIYENEALGTAGALALIDNWSHDTVLVMNSDLLTNINFEEFYLYFKENDADLAVACVPYQVNIPYAVMETEGNIVKGFKEKPTYTHYSNAGIYLMKRDVINQIPKNAFYNATDLMEELINKGKKVVSFPMICYWLDIGKHEDYKKAQEDIKHIKF